MTQETKHTPLPWYVDGNPSGCHESLRGFKSLWYKRPDNLGRGPTIENVAENLTTEDAHFVCIAVNSHDKLVEALKLNKEQMEADAEERAMESGLGVSEWFSCLRNRKLYEETIEALRLAGVK